jgi:hypothetical protein
MPGHLLRALRCEKKKGANTRFNVGMFRRDVHVIGAMKMRQKRDRDRKWIEKTITANSITMEASVTV